MVCAFHLRRSRVWINSCKQHPTSGEPFAEDNIMQQRCFLYLSSTVLLEISLANCCAVRVKSLWPRNRPIRQVGTSQGTTLMTQTPQYMLMRRWSWSTTCWRSLHCPGRQTSSTLRSATVRHLSDPPRAFTVQFVSPPQVFHFRNDVSTCNRALFIRENLITQRGKMKVVW